MKFYIAGIYLDHEIRNLPPKQACAQLIDMIPEIVNDAKRALGRQVLTLIVLHEYSMTKNPIEHEDKQACLVLLKKAVQDYENVILIPGTFSTYQKLIHAPEKIEKIKHNYSLLNQFHLFKLDRNFNQERKHSIALLKHKKSQPYYLENSAYLLTKDNKIKHKKCFPWEERDRFTDTSMKDQSVYYIGAETPVYTIKPNRQPIDIGVIICREHIDNEITNLTTTAPLIEVVVSSTISAKTKSLYGALNIHMDSCKHLAVYKNTLHSKANLITGVQAVEYLKTNNRMKNNKKNIQIVEFESAFEKPEQKPDTIKSKYKRKPDHDLTHEGSPAKKQKLSMR